MSAYTGAGDSDGLFEELGDTDGDSELLGL